MAFSLPNGYLHENHLVFGDPLTGAVLSRGYKVDFPDLSSSDEETHERLERDLRSIHASLVPGARMQWILYTGSNFDAPLKRFRAQTDAGTPPAFCREIRNELFERFWQRKEDQRLIQTNSRLFLSAKLQPFQNDKGRRVKAFDEVFAVQQRDFENRRAGYDSLLAAYGGGVTPLDDLGHYEEFLRFWSPEQARRPMPAQIDPRRTLKDLCRFSERSPRAVDHGFYCNGHYFGVLAFKALPPSTGMDTLQAFVGLAVPGLRVTVNVEALSVGDELRHQAERYKTFVQNVKDAPHDLLSKLGMNRPEQQGEALLSGMIKPMRIQVLVIAYDRTRDGLDQKLAALGTLIHNLGAEPYQPALWASTFAFYDCATPGYGPWLKYDYQHKIWDLNAAHLVPAGSTPRGELDEADVIFDGDDNNLIGWKAFAGSQPIPTLVVGQAGSGKSVTVQTVLAQTAHRVNFLAILDDGRSHEATARKLDPTCRPIVVRPNGSLCFNLFDTRGLPLSPQHLSDAASLAHLLVGSAQDEYRDKIARSVLLEHVRHVYDDAYDRWRKAHPARAAAVCREALVLLRFRNAKLRKTDALADVFAAARDLRREDPEALLEFEEMDPDEAAELGYAPETEKWVRDLSFATWAPEEFPRLFNLYDELKAASNQKASDAALCGELSKLLWRWTARYGAYGPIVDGVNNVDLGSANIRPTDPLKVVYVELGEIGKASKELKAVVGFLIANQLRNHVEQMPRATRKQLVMEELTSLLQAPDAERLVSDYFERMRKFHCQLYAVFQQWGSVAELYPHAARSMIGNCLALLLFRNNREDLEALKKKLPPAVIDRITAFSQPESMKDEARRHAAFAYVLITGQRPLITFGRNVISHELEAVVTSSADQFEARQQRLQQEGNDESKAA